MYFKFRWLLLLLMQTFKQQQNPGTRKWLLLWIVFFGKVVSIPYLLSVFLVFCACNVIFLKAF